MMYPETRRSSCLLNLMIISAILMVALLFSHTTLASPSKTLQNTAPVTNSTTHAKVELLPMNDSGYDIPLPVLRSTLDERIDAALIPASQGHVITYTWTFESGLEGWAAVDFGGYGPSYWEANPSLGNGVGVWQTILTPDVRYRYGYIMFPHPVSLDRVTVDYYIHESGFNVGGAAFWVYTSTNQSNWQVAATIPQYEPSGGGHYSRSADVVIDDKYVMVGMRVNRAFADIGAPYPYGYLDNVTFRNCTGCDPLVLEVVDFNNNLVNNLSNNSDGWPAPNPLTAAVTLFCPAGGPDCIDSLNLSINSATTPRFYVYGWEEVAPDPNSLDLLCDETTSGSEFSYQSYTASCPTRGSGGVTVPFAVFAGESVTVQWHVWVQPSTAVDLDFSATWGTNTVTRTVQVPQANIHPIALFQGFFGNSESFVALLFEPLIITLEKMGYQRDHTLFVGKYDYIGDIADAAVELSDQLVNWQVTARQVDWVNKFPDDQEGFFDLMALSQGALMARTYAQTGTYPVDLHRLLLVGGPNRGAPYVYRAREGLEADAGLWQLGLDFILPLKALTCGHVSVAGPPSNPIIYASTMDRYETLHDPNCGIFFLSQILPAPGPNDPAYLFDDTGSYPFGRQANPLLEPPPANPVDDPWWSPTNPVPSTTYLNLNSPASLAILSDRIGGFGKLYLLYNDAINEAQGYRVHPNTEVAPLWRNGRVLDPLSFTGPSDGSVPFYSARAADLWSGSQPISLTVLFDDRDEIHANLPVYPESQQKIAQILTGITPPFITTLNAMNNYVQGDVAAALKGLFITGMSPIELSITDPSGRRLGYDVTTSQIVDEIPTGIYEHLPDDTANLWIFDPLPGDYEFTVVGTDAGSYTILAQFVDATASVPILYKQDNILPAEVLTMTLAVPAKSEDVPYPPDVFAGPDRDALAGMPVTFMGTVSDINPGDTFTSLWDFGDSGGATNTLTPIHTFTDDGAYLVTLTVTDSTGFVVSDTLQVIVTQPPIYLPIILKQASGAATLTAPAIDDNLPFISPIPTPTPIPPSSIINNLIANLDVACQQRQVDNQGVCHSLRGKLVKAQQYFNEGATDKAANELRAFINEVTAQQGKHITVEIANRWITTAQQLLRQLQEQG